AKVSVDAPAVGLGAARSAKLGDAGARSPTAVGGAAAMTASVALRAGRARASVPEDTFAPPAGPHGDPAVKRYNATALSPAPARVNPTVSPAVCLLNSATNTRPSSPWTA